MFKKCIKVFMAFMLVSCMCLEIHATDITDLQEEKRDKESKKKEAEEVVDRLQGEMNDILSDMELLDNEIATYTDQLVELQKKKDELEADIDVTKAELEEAEKQADEQYEAMKKHIQYAYENGYTGYASTILLAGDISDIMDRREYNEQVYNYDYRLLIELAETKKLIADKKLELESDLEAVEQVEEEVQDNMDATKVLVDAKEIQIANYTDSIEEQEAAIAAYEADIAATDAAIAEWEAEQRRKNEEIIAAGGTVPIYYTGGTFQWPVASGGTITSYFGPRTSPTAGASSYHKGLDIGCSTGTPIVAGEGGTVIAASYSNSMGNYVVIDHGNGVSTTYMHNSGLAVSSGQTVSRGQVIAYAGSTGISTGTHCHFAVRINGQYVDPLPYLR